MKLVLHSSRSAQVLLRLNASLEFFSISIYYKSPASLIQRNVECFLREVISAAADVSKGARLYQSRGC